MRATAKELEAKGVRVVEDCSGCYGELIAAKIAIKLTALLYVAYLLRSASRAFDAFRPFQAFQVISAFSLIALVLLKEIDQISIHGALP